MHKLTNIEELKMFSMKKKIAQSTSPKVFNLVILTK